MKEFQYYKELIKCVRCGTCKSFCPTYLTTLNETMGARGRVAMLGELIKNRLSPTSTLADRIFSCMLCDACKSLCPTGINIPEVIYHGRVILKDSYKKGRFLRATLKHFIFRLDAVFAILRSYQRIFYHPLYKIGLFRKYMPEITSRPFKNSIQVYKNIKKTSRVAIFAGCSVNYFYPNLGNALTNILLSRGHEVVVFKGESCCGAPLRSMGLEKEASTLAKRNIEHFNKVHAEAIISLCPTCTMFIKEKYPVLAGNTIVNIMDVNEFLIKYNLATHLEVKPAVFTYHDPCHLNYGLGIKNEPREILKSIKGINFIEMNHADECCGFGGFFSLYYKDISRDIGMKKIENICSTSADTVVTSCPGCIMHLEAIKREKGAKFNVKHIIEVVEEALHDDISN
jgi:glycolate oxidase iron-sulfur subunit